MGEEKILKEKKRNERMGWEGQVHSTANGREADEQRQARSQLRENSHGAFHM
jgi:hypothetical protein